MKRLVIITTRFPYFYTEAFLEAEYPYLQKAFDDIVFLPLIKGKKREQCQDAVVCDDYNKLYSHKSSEYLKVLFSSSFYKDLWKHKYKLTHKNRIAHTYMQQIHYRILKRVVLSNLQLFDENTVVYSYWFNAPVYAFLKIREELGLNYKVIARAHRFDVYDEKGEMPNRTYCLRNIDKVYPISQDAIDFISGKYGYKDKFVLSRLGVKDYRTISSPSESGEYHILSVSQVNPRKRIKEIFESICALSKKREDINIIWTHFGDGPQLQDLKSWAQESESHNLKIEVKGRVPNTEIMTYMSSTPIDVFINLSTSEGVPVSVMEAQSYGIPVVATDVGGTAEIMNKDNGCLLAANPTEEEVVRALNHVISNNYDRRRIKSMWNEMSNAQVNFTNFVNHLAQL